MLSAITPRGLEINLDAGLPFEAIEVARQLLRTTRVASLATIDPSGFPYSTVTNLAVEADGTPFFWVAFLALHARNIDLDPRVSITVAQDGGDAMTSPRLTLSGRAERVGHNEIEALKASYLRLYPKGKLYLPLPDTRMYRVRIEGVQLNGGPARNANNVTPDDLMTDLRGADDLMEAQADLAAWLDRDGRASRLAVIAGARPGRWSATMIDPDGVTLSSASGLARHWFAAPCRTKAAFLAAIGAALA